MKSVYIRRDNSFMSLWDRIVTRWNSIYTIKEYGNGDFHIYENCIGFVDTRVHVTSSLDFALDWCEKQLKDAEVKSTTYVTWGE